MRIERLPEWLLDMLDRSLFSKVKPRVVEGGVLQVACPNYKTKPRPKKDRSSWRNTIKVFHRMKIDERKNKWFCVKCRRRGSLKSLAQYLQ